YNKYCTYVKNGIVGKDDPYIIAINRSELEHVETPVPLILKCLFGVGYQTIFISSNKPRLNDTESFWSPRKHIKKKNGVDVPTEFFNDPAHLGISAVIYLETDIIRNPRSLENMGDNFTVVLNPHA